MPSCSYSTVVPSVQVCVLADFLCHAAHILYGMVVSAIYYMCTLEAVELLNIKKLINFKSFPKKYKSI